MAKILLIDDEELLCEVLTTKLVRLGHEVDSTHTLADGLVMAEAPGGYDIIFLDVHMPDGNGLDLVEPLKNVSSRPEIIIMTGVGDPDGAETAIKTGAWSYIEKARVTREMILPLERALLYRNERLARSRPPRRKIKRSKIIGESSAIQRSLDQLVQAAQSDVPVLLTGETGVGKELFARGIHENSSRANNNFVIVDCAALPETLVESTLFGHIRGAYTGAGSDRRGLILNADGGTLFLDEIGELPLVIQKKFLRVLQERCFRPVGASDEVRSNFRLIVASNKNIEEMVSAGDFREDLFYRINAFHIHLPPLRKRQEDIAILTSHHLNSLCRHYGIEAKDIPPEFLKALEHHTWPGNVRELFRVLDRVFTIAIHSDTLHSQYLPDEIRISLIQSGLAGKVEAADKGSVYGANDTPPLWATVKEETQRNYFRSLLETTGGNIAAMSRLSGVGRSRIYQILEKFELKPNS